MRPSFERRKAISPIKIVLIAFLSVSSLGMEKEHRNCETKLKGNGVFVQRKIALRPLIADDVDAFLTWAGDPEVTRSLFWDHYGDRTLAEKFLQEIAEPHPWFMAILMDGTPVGAVTLDKGKGRAAHRAELGYVIAKSFWGQGIATEAVQLALEKGFQDLGIERIEAFVDPNNLGSVRVLEKAGLEREGYLKKYVIHRGQVRDRYIYGKTK